MDSFFNFYGAGVKDKAGNVSSFNPFSFNGDSLLGIVKGMASMNPFKPNTPSTPKAPVTSPSQVSPPSQVVPKVDRTFAPASNIDSSNILRLIASVESGNNYDIIVGGKTDKNLRSSTISQLSKKYGRKALGMYQIQMPTAIGILKANNIDPTNFKFDENGQTTIAKLLLKHRGYGRIKDPNVLARNLSKEWASLPRDASNKSYYDGVQGNAARVDFNTLVNTLKKIS